MAGATVVAPARAADVVSSNVVGYSKLTMNKGSYTLISNPFTEVGTGENIAINDMFAEDGTAGNAGSSVTTADTIEVWDGSGYVSYYLRNATPHHWRKVGERAATTDEIPEGAAAFYHNYSNDDDVTLTVSGEVKAESETLTIVGSGYTLVKNPFPVELDFDNFVVEGATAGTSVTSADTIEVWDGSGYVSYYLRSGTPNHWRKVGERNKTTDTIAPYTGFFYHALGENDFTVTVQSPLADSSSGN